VSTGIAGYGQADLSWEYLERVKLVLALSAKKDVISSFPPGRGCCCLGLTLQGEGVSAVGGVL
jgi:hypothetical protein